jgi:hypothetical protein
MRHKKPSMSWAFCGFYQFTIKRLMGALYRLIQLV